MSLMDPKNDMAQAGEDKVKRNRAAYNAKASSDFYGGAGWVIGLFITLFIATPAIWLLLQTATRSTFNDRLLIGISIAWWFNPLSLGRKLSGTEYDPHSRRTLRTPGFSGFTTCVRHELTALSNPGRSRGLSSVTETPWP